MSRVFYIEKKLATLETLEDKKCKNLSGETVKDYFAVVVQLGFHS